MAKNHMLFKTPARACEHFATFYTMAMIYGSDAHVRDGATFPYPLPLYQFVNVFFYQNVFLVFLYKFFC